MIFDRRKFLQASSIGASGLGSFFLPVMAQQSTVDADTQFGKVRGIRAGEVNIFKGIPYGEDTSGANRFMPPKDPLPWGGIKETFAYGPAAPQSDPERGIQQDGYESEDCLVLNVSICFGYLVLQMHFFEKNMFLTSSDILYKV